MRCHPRMTTPENHQNTGKLEHTLDGIQRKVGDISSMVKGMYEKVSELADTTDSIYDALAYQHETSLYGHGHDDLLDDLE